MWFAGAGIKGGTVVGNTDELGIKAVEDVYHTHDMHATMLRLMGLDDMRLTYYHAGRFKRLPGRFIGPVGTVSEPAAVAPNLATDRGRCATQRSGNRTDRAAGHHTAGDLLPFRQRQRPSRSSPRPRPYHRPGRSPDRADHGLATAT